MLFNNIKKECFKDADSFLDKNSIYDHYLDIEEILNLYKINMYSLSDDYIVLINKTYNDYVESFK